MRDPQYLEQDTWFTQSSAQMSDITTLEPFHSAKKAEPCGPALIDVPILKTQHPILKILLNKNCQHYEYTDGHKAKAKQIDQRHIPFSRRRQQATFKLIFIN